MSEWLKKLYSYDGEFFLLIGPNAIVMVEDPEIESYLFETETKLPVTTLRLFMDVVSAERYRDFVGALTCRIVKTTLVGLWGILDRINKLSMSQHKMPVRVVVSAIDCEGNPRVVDTLTSAPELRS
jgi:hypothetical protein